MTVRIAPHNRRENVIGLTPAGTGLVRRGDAAFEREKSETLPALAPDDLAAAIRVLAAMNGALEPEA